MTRSPGPVLAVLPLLAGCAALLAGCGQKGPLYLPDEGLRSEVVPRIGAPAAPAPTSGPDAAPAPGTDTGAGGAQSTPPVTTTPDRTNEPRKRIHTP